MATVKIRKKVAVVSRKTPEKTRNNQSQNTLDPEMAPEYISLVSEEIKRRVIEKPSEEFSLTELGAGMLGALSKLDEILLNPHVRICSIAVPRTTWNNDSEN